ncbi:MAG TPA: RNA 2'-phosphotransferase, partial [Puia sp.]|nr:RNA 2'-phosphotransferase [Puia sp.]
SKSAMNNVCFSKEDLEEVVVTNDKQRFSFSDGGTRIRANQGHSIAVELQLKPQKPPQVLFHGTVGKFLNSIKEKGLQKMDRHHVHLSADRSTAERVGNRRGEAVILTVKSYEMGWDGFEFFLSENGVWLTDHVPVRYIEFF